MNPGAFEVMLRERLSDSLAASGQFRVVGGRGPMILPSFIDAVNCAEGSLELDPVAISEFLGHYAFFGSRTALRQVKRTDFYEILDFADSPQHRPVPQHGEKVEDVERIAENFLRLLVTETHSRLEGCEHVGLLLSGGMDSRIVAGVLRNLQQGESSFRVTCFTWGRRDTRDPSYAETIARKYGWGFEHFDLGAEALWENINAVAHTGCFHSALHLHAMLPVAQRAAELGVQLMFAGSYGDSIGRAEYSRVHVSALPPIEHRLRNWYGVMDPLLYAACRNQTLREIERCRSLYGAENNLEVHELDRQLHYMRNMLGSAMGVIDAQVPLAQAFTSRAVVQYMWGLAPECRTDETYFHLLSELDPELLEIPWARTGCVYLGSDHRPDSLPASFHDYPAWTREIFGRVRQSIFSGAIEQTGVFDMRAIKDLVKAFDKCEFISAGRVPEILVWLASMGMFLERVDIVPRRDSGGKRPMRVKSRLELAGTIAKQYFLFGRGHQRSR